MRVSLRGQVDGRLMGHNLMRKHDGWGILLYALNLGLYDSERGYYPSGRHLSTCRPCTVRLSTLAPRIGVDVV